MIPVMRRLLVVSVFAAACTAALSAQVTKKDIAGISTFAQVESTIACGGTTTPDAIREIKRMGFKTVVNLRLASEQGALVDEEGAIVRSLGMNYVHLPFNIQTPDPKLVENFIAAVAGADEHTGLRPLRGRRPRGRVVDDQARQGRRLDASGRARGGECPRPQRPAASIRAELSQGAPVVPGGAAAYSTAVASISTRMSGWNSEATPSSVPAGCTPAACNRGPYTLAAWKKAGTSRV